MLQPFDRHAVLPILIAESVDATVRAAAALLEGGLDAVEVTLRTPHALAAIEAIAKALPAVVVGAGTVLRPADVTAARQAGAQFLSSPGLTLELAASGLASGLPYAPGAATASEVMTAREMSFSFLRFFPASDAGGVGTLNAFALAFSGMMFCAAGGITEANAPDYLALPNVAAVTGIWIATPEAIAAGDWAGITARARRAVALAARRS